MAICGTDTIRKVVNVAAGQCIKDEVNFNVTPPTVTGSWSFRDSATHRTYSGTWAGPAYFGPDFFNSGGKAMYLTGTTSSSGSDTTMDLYVHFPASATAPVPGTYVTIPDFNDKSNNTDWYLYDGSTGDYYYYVRELFSAPPPAGLKLTIVVTSFNPTTKVVKGTFSGKALNAADVLVDITNGTFEAVVQL
jgi:hypothetical protein